MIPLWKALDLFSGLFLHIDILISICEMYQDRFISTILHLPESL